MKITLILSSMFLACSIHAQSVAQLQTEVNQLKTLCAQMVKNEQGLQAQLSQLQRSPVQGLAPFVSVDYNAEAGVTPPNITFHGANIHIVDGSGTTASVNGLGNLIIGYDEFPTTYAYGDRGGSHNLVMGSQNKFNTWSYSGIVNGVGNLIGGQEDVILSGSGNRITGNVSPEYHAFGVIVTGGGQQLFDAPESAIVGGSGNDIEYINSVILGGTNNSNGGVYSVILGGQGNTVQHYTGIDQYIIIPDVGNHFGISLPTLPKP
jgi:hypothetical protein